MAANPSVGLCIDWETSGSAWGDDTSKYYQGVSFGAIAFNTSDFSIIDTLYREIKFDETKYKWSNEAERIHGLSKEYLEKNGIDREDAAVDLIQFINNNFKDEKKIMFLGHNPEFDRRMTNQLMGVVNFEFSIERLDKLKTHIALHHVMLDTSALGFITMDKYKSNELFESMGFTRDNHNALEDAMFTVQTCAAIKAIFNIGMENL